MKTKKRLILLLPLLIFLAFLGIKTQSIRETKAQYFCAYKDTQARVQNNIQVPWAQSINVGCERSFNVGSFHNGTGQFAGDTTLQVVGPNGYNGFFSNGQTVTVPNDGTYTLVVSTNGQLGNGCTQMATINVSCPVIQTNQQIQPVNPSTCNYQSTQARVQQDNTKPWSQSLALSCGQLFNVGSFHNNTGLFTEDSIMRVTCPQNLDVIVKNAETIRALYPGRYTLSVTTPSQSGPNCQESATVDVNCSLWWKP